MTDIESARAIVDRFYALLNERDVGNIPEVLTEDVVFDDDIWPDLIRGHAELERFLSSLWRAVPDFRFTLRAGPYVAEDGSSIAVRVQAGGTFSGPLDPPGYAPTGRPVTAEYGGFFELERGRIKRGRVILNVNDVGVQIGALPAPGSVADRLGVILQRLNARRLRARGTAYGRADAARSIPPERAPR